MLWVKWTKNKTKQTNKQTNKNQQRTNKQQKQKQNKKKSPLACSYPTNLVMFFGRQT